MPRGIFHPHRISRNEIGRQTHACVEVPIVVGLSALYCRSGNMKENPGAGGMLSHVAVRVGSRWTWSRDWIHIDPDGHIHMGDSL